VEIQIAPYQNAVDYLKTQAIPVGIRSTTRIILEDLLLTFQPSFPIPRDLVAVRYRCSGCEVAANALEYFQIAVTPSLLFLPYTNYFDVAAVYRRPEGRRRSSLYEATSLHASYLVVGQPPIFQPAQVFVSFKDPEDLELASLVGELLRRSGLESYLAREDPRPGSEYWRDKIEPAIRSSVALTVVWTHKTVGHDVSVVREVRIARRAGIPDVLLLEKGICTERVPPNAA
jgi:hypothetical protein